MFLQDIYSCFVTYLVHISVEPAIKKVDMASPTAADLKIEIIGDFLQCTV